MKNLKIAILAKTKYAELTYNYPPNTEEKFQYWTFFLYVMDESYSPIMNLQTSDFTFNFLNTAPRTHIYSRSLDVVYKAAPIYSSNPPISSLFGLSPLPNPTVQSFNGFYRGYVQQLLSDANVLNTSTLNYPAKYVEISINSPTLDASGNGIFILIS